MAKCIDEHRINIFHENRDGVLSCLFISCLAI